MSRSKYYVVWRGYRTGVFNSWEKCKEAIKGYEGAQYKSYKSKSEAESAFKEPAYNHIGKKGGIRTEIKQKRPIVNSLSVDAACSGNPGKMEYQGVHTGTKKVWFHQIFEEGTNNIGEFIAIVHGLAEMKRRKTDIPLYTDSETALNWVKNKKCKTTLKKNSKTEELFKMIERAEQWLHNNSWQQPIYKWDTKNWGEIPADFGRK
ncbi:ribonuclease H family protein [Marinilabiliaceae bacterium ANBcel2]|nr:ribonuclease H family protein [Marinilabiliaceae bacterium ANBcel2]